MKRSKLFFGIFGLLTIFGLASWSESQEPALQPQDVGVAKDPIEVQVRGIIHEAYAQPFDDKTEPGPMVPKAPPPPLPEDPPEQRPAAENAQWMPGYWAWDSERSDHVWISGVYRVPPQNRQFVPGYWTQAGEGWRWIAGFWSNPQQDVPYTPEPPATLDNGPQMPAPDDNSAYIPGSWIYRDARFVWRPGYYSAIQTGQIWNPPHYVWTPNGYVFVNGYYDLPYEDRGLVFAPVYFNQPLWQTPGWRYRPNFVVGYNSFFDSAFIGIGGFNFFFGNYYGPHYAQAGYRPWYNGRGRYDPMFAHHGWNHHRNNPNWVAGQQQTYAARSAGRAPVPPTTFAQQGQFNGGKKGPSVVTPLNQFTSTNVKLVNTTPAQIQLEKAAVQRSREAAANRQVVETASKQAPTRNIEPRTVRFDTLTDPKAPKGPAAINNPPFKGPTTINNPPTKGPAVINNPPPSKGPAVINNPPSKGQAIINNPPAKGPAIINNLPKGPSTPLPIAPKVNLPAPNINTTPPRINPPPPPPPRINPPSPTPPGKRSAEAPVPTPAKNVLAAPAKAPTVAPRPAPAPVRVATPAPRVSAPAVRSAPVRSAPVRSSPAARPSAGGKRR